MNNKKVIHFTIGPIGAAALGFITLPLTAWFFSPEDIGRISLLNVVVGLAVMFFSLGLDQSYVREYHESNNTPLLWKTCFLPGFLLLIALCFYGIVNAQFLSQVIFDIPSYWYGFGIIVCLISAYCVRFFSLILRMQERGLAFSFSQILPKIIYLIALLIFVLLQVDYSITQLLIATALSTFFVMLLFAWNTRNEWLIVLFRSLDIVTLKEMLKYSIPLFLSGLAFWGINSLDRIMLKRYSTLEELGFFSVAMSFASVAFIFQSVFTTIWAPIAYKWLKNNVDMSRIFQIAEYMTLFIILLFALAGVLSWVVDFILPSEYFLIKYLIVPCLGIPLFYTLSETTVIGINITKKTGYAMTATVMALVVGVLLNYLLIPSFGAIGAAVASCWTFYIFFILRTEFSCLVWKAMPRIKIYLQTFVVTLLSSFMVLLGAEYYNVFLVLWLVVVIYSILALYRVRHEILGLISGN